MKKTVRALLLILIISLSLILTSCQIIDLFRDERHSCSYDSERVISQHSCTTDGIVIRSCICGRESTTVTPAGGHRFGDWQTVREADCTTHGKLERICEVCQSVESRETPKLAHRYEISGEQVGEVMFNRYTCLDCGESFAIDSGIAIPPEVEGELILTDCKKDFSFVIISTADEEYIKTHLKIYEAQGYLSSRIEYSITDLGDGRHLITSDEYLPGKSYIAEREGGVFFADYGNPTLIFSLANEKRAELGLSGEVIYIAALEENSPGYYPFSVEFSDGSGGVFLSLEKSEGLLVGDLICVGSAKNADDVILGNGDNLFGRISSITKLTDGRSLVMLAPVSTDELFEKLDIYSDSLSSTSPLHPSVSLEAKILAALLGDPDFTDLAEAFYLAGQKFLAARDLDMPYKSVEELIAQIRLETVRESSLSEDDGSMSALSEIIIEMAIPVNQKNEKLGEIFARLTYTTKITADRVLLNLTASEFNLDCYINLTNGVDFTSDANLTYGSKTHILLRDSQGTYHLHGCESVVGRSSDQSLHQLLANEEALLCEDCMIEELISNLYVIDGKSYHRIGCEELVITDNLLFLEGTPDSEELEPCENCIKDKPYESIFKITLLECIGDLPDREIADDHRPVNITIAVFGSSVSGIDRQLYELTMTLDFILRPEAEYSQSNEGNLSYHYRIIDGKLQCFTTTSVDFTDVTLDLTLEICGLTVKYE